MLGLGPAAIVARRDGVASVALDAAVGTAIVEAAAWHGLEALTEHRLRERGLHHTLPDGARDRLSDAVTVATLRAAARRRQLRELLTALAANDVPTIVLKGAYLAEHAYAGAAHRPMSDVDLLVPREALARAVHSARTLGYAQPPTDFVSDRHAPPLERPGRLPVELHHAIEPCVSPLRLPLDEVWARATPCTVAGAPALALAPEDLLLHLAAHACHSHVLGASLVSAYDVHAWAMRHGETADWDALVTRAHAVGLRRFVYAVLALAVRTLGAPVPSAPLAALRGRGDDAIVDRAARLLVAPPFLVLGAKSVTDPRDSALARVRRIGRALRPRPAARRTGESPPAPTVPEAAGASGASASGGRVRVLARMLLHPGETWRALRQVAGVRALRRWAVHRT